MAASEVQGTVVLLRKTVWNVNRLAIILALSAFTCLSCKENVEKAVSYHPYVGKVLSDSTDRNHAVLSRYSNVNRNGTIAVAGPSDECSALVDFMMSADMFDNVDGKPGGDRLPDFAGEVFTSCNDCNNSPYIGKPEELVAEIAVRNALFAISDSCYSSVLMRHPDMKKIPSKVLILSSSMMSSNGYSDVDTMFVSAGVDVPVISHAHSLVETAFDVLGNDACVGVWTDGSVLASGVYASVFHDVSMTRGHLNYVCFAPEGYKNVKDGLLKFLDMYMAYGHTAPLSAVLLDGIALSGQSAALRTFAETLKADSKYGKLIAEDFEIVDALSAIASNTYRLMRNNNSFTHKVAYPASVKYAAPPGQELETMRYVCE